MRKLLLFLLSLTLSASVSGESCCDRDGAKELDDVSSFWYPYGSTIKEWSPSVASGNLGFVLDAAGEMASWCGVLHWAGVSSDTVTGGDPQATIQFLPGTTTYANGTTSTNIGIGDLDTANGPPGRFDETLDVYGTMTSTSNTPASNTWISVPIATGSAKTLTAGSIYCLAADMTARGGADSLIINGVSGGGSQWPVSALKTGGTWAAPSTQPAANAIITSDSGVIGWLDGSWVESGLTNAPFNSGSTPDEKALICTLPFDAVIDGVAGVIALAGGTSDYEFVVYRDPLGTPVIAKDRAGNNAVVSVDGNTSLSSAQRNASYEITKGVVIKGGVPFAVSVRPTTSNNVTVGVFNVASATHFVSHPGGSNCYYGTRSDQTGAFSATTTSRPMIYVRIRSIDGTRRH